MNYFILLVLLLVVYTHALTLRSRKSDSTRTTRGGKRVNPRRYSSGAYTRRLEGMEEYPIKSVDVNERSISLSADEVSSPVFQTMDMGEDCPCLDDALSEPIQVMCEVNGFMVPAIIDTGAQISVMSSSCAKRCRISHDVDTRFAGRAVGVGSTDILGRINDIPLRVGPLTFNGKISVLRETAGVDFLLGRDFLRRFRSDICMRNNMLTMHVRDKVLRMPLLSRRPQSMGETEFMADTATAAERVDIVATPFDESGWQDVAPISDNHHQPVEFAAGTVQADATLDNYGDLLYDMGERVSMEGV